MATNVWIYSIFQRNLQLTQVMELQKNMLKCCCVVFVAGEALDFLMKREA
jgi:hypothetical protein